MKKLKSVLKSASQAAFSKATGIEKESNEDWRDYEERVWREKTHIDEVGNIIIPPQMFKGAVSLAVKYLNIKIPGERNATYTKNFAGGVIFENGIDLGITRDELEGNWIHVPSDGKPGGSSRVFKKFPFIPKWEGSINVLILDPKITTEVFERVLVAAGLFIGIGFWRPAKGGSNGRFEVLSVEEIN